MANGEKPGLDRAGAEHLLGRRLRPWWGTAPWQLALRGAIGAALFGAMAYGAFQVSRGSVDLSEVEEQREVIEQVALPIAIVAALFSAYGVLRLVVGLLDLFGRRTVEGVVVRKGERQVGDVLPRPLQRALLRRGRHGRSGIDNRRVRLELVVETADGPSSWNVRRRIFTRTRQGQTVRLTATPLLGYVTSVDADEAAVPAPPPPVARTPAAPPPPPPPAGPRHPG
jgi:hypothetical protein